MNVNDPQTSEIRAGAADGKAPKRRGDDLSWAEVGMFAVGSLAGAVMGVLALVYLVAAMAAKAPGFWFVSRAAGIVAFLLLWLSTASGVMLSSKGIGGLISGPLAYTLHNVTSWLALGFGAVHALSLLGDRIVSFTAISILVPFVSPYQPLLTGLGTLSLYAGVLVSVSFAWKKRIGYRAWRIIHMLSYLMFAAVTVHGVMLGTDSSTQIMQVIYMVSGGSVVFLTLFRIFTAGSQGGRAATGTPATVAVRVRE
jgi:predicted ferric reductase